jgi:acyl-CoA thioesterase I
MSWTRRDLGLSLLTLGAALALPGCGRPRMRADPVMPGAAVLALGDSLTFGTGAAPDAAYPAVLERLTGWQLHNAGVPGDTSAQALERLPDLLQPTRPALVLLCIGGNDFLRRVPESDTRRRVRTICETVRTAGAQLLLIAVPRPTLSAAFTGSLSDHPLYGDIAEALRLPLHRQGWSEVLADESLRSDAIHANAQGYARFAQGLVATARTVGLLVSR